VYGDQDLDRSSVISLWIMTGVMGLLTAVAVLVINRRRPYSPWVLLVSCRWRSQLSGSYKRYEERFLLRLQSVAALDPNSPGGGLGDPLRED
jgi:hypothetical protein